MADDDTEVDDIVEEALSRRRNVKEILVEMKDTSELMIDLAYTALLTNSTQISEEVEELESRMDDLLYEIEVLCMLAARTPEDAADLTGIMRVGHSAEKVADAAAQIVDVVFRGVGDHPIYSTFLGETEEKVAKIQVNESSSLIGKTLGEYRFLKETGCFVRAIKRGSTWIYSPKKETQIKLGDILIVIGERESINKVQQLCCT
ncbi:MAG: potassium channel protein [Candidatus Altiarchaeales archaeon]|nr:potassium channel protein [Candidatus Altiarchaeales archaeon]